MQNTHINLAAAIRGSLYQLAREGKYIATQKWQGVEAPAPMFETIGIHFVAPMEETMAAAERMCQPNLPWANAHFQERVGGKPTNPGVTYHAWPYWRGGHMHENKFTHTYQERMWTPPLDGIRFKFGNLDTLVTLLRNESDTRQAFLPIWFPEDTGVAHGGRVPCSIGYHFIIRDGLLNVTYYLRSCDARRHFSDDVYLCHCLALWIRNRLKISIEDLSMGSMTVQIVSFHIFKSDVSWLNQVIKCAE